MGSEDSAGRSVEHREVDGAAISRLPSAAASSNAADSGTHNRAPLSPAWRRICASRLPSHTIMHRGRGSSFSFGSREFIMEASLARGQTSSRDRRGWMRGSPGSREMRLGLSAIASAILAACGHQPHDATSMGDRTMEVVDLANAIAYRIPYATCPSCNDGLNVATTAVEPTHHQDSQPMRLAIAPEATDVAATNNRIQLPDSTVEAAIPSDTLPTLRLKLDTEFASLRRLVPSSFGKSSLGAR